ncbi:Succinate dehydrogenase cytochrome b558 subunit [Posidoniimonas corsicana]|uniref:Succinate dehydrogenase cytochrome b558 subunit n=1 Tax=Posidoniimonas corsicana TaxID=1938618 RepID=A0A5C5V2P5_9BACT|nr:succinate dehydrogenase cytochrome b558 subunit [Posidoniimonas corsicana]TWT32260.1 Succinate dehydrogenase cytochrome b558 subunit [Posidoniimonas corsicana]
MADSSLSFLQRHEFLIRRLHSLSGLVPVGAYMCVHLLTNASILNSAETFQNNVYTIHSLDKALPIVEWLFIFLPIIFHAVIGVVIIKGGLPNNSNYKYGPNWRYTLQRATGMIAFVFIFLHVFHLHGWFHGEAWLEFARSVGGASFSPFNAASTLKVAMSGFVVPVLYAIGVLSCVFHLANGIWTMGITWGAWTTPKAQQTALGICSGFGVLLAIVGMSALWGAANPETYTGETSVEAIREVEDQMYEARVEMGMVGPNEHKRYHEVVKETEQTEE